MRNAFVKAKWKGKKKGKERKGVRLIKKNKKKGEKTISIAHVSSLLLCFVHSLFIFDTPF